MKKFKKIISLILILLTVTGCVKMEVSMDIKKDKSMTLGIIQALDKSLMEKSGGSSSLMDTEEIKELEEKGYKVENYTENDMTGYKITKEIKNIDEVSTEEEITANLGTEELADNEYIFTVKKGLFKNTYKAILKNSDTEELNESLNSGLTNDTTYEEDINDEEDITYDDDIILEDEDTYDDTNDNSSINGFEDFDYSALMSSIDVKMKVNLPYKALSNNATTIENDGTTLIWDLMNFEKETIEFQFEMYNTTNIIILSVIVVIAILLIIFLIIKKSKKKKQNNNNIVLPTNNEASQPNTNTINNVQTPITPVESNNIPTNVAPTEPLMNNIETITTNNIEPINVNITPQEPSTTPTQQPNIFEPQAPTQPIFENNIQPIQPVEIQNQAPTMTSPISTPITEDTQPIENNTIQSNINVPLQETSTTPTQQPNIFEPQAPTQPIFENNIQPIQPVEIQNQAPTMTSPTPTPITEDTQPIENNNIQSNINVSLQETSTTPTQQPNIFEPQVPNTDNIKTNTPLEPLPQPLNLEQIGVIPNQQEPLQNTSNQEQNITQQPTSQYDAILQSTNTDK